MRSLAKLLELWPVKVATAIGIVFAARSTRAQPAPAEEPPAVIASPTDPDRLERFLDGTASNARRDRIAGIVVNGALAAMTVPPGIILAAKDDPALEVAGVSLLVTGGWGLFALATKLIPSQMETLRDHYAARKAKGKPPGDAASETEQEWQHAIDRARRDSYLDATLNLAAGAFALATGTYLLLQGPGVSGYDRREQTVVGTILVGVALPITCSGIYELFGRSWLEEAWALYRSGKPRAPLMPSIAVAPVRGGATGAVGFTF